MQASRFLAIIKATLIIIPLGFAAHLSAAEELNKQQLLAAAVDICQDASAQKYGENSLVSSAKAQWESGLDGASVKLKVKERGRQVKYSCLVKADKSVLFHKS